MTPAHSEIKFGRDAASLVISRSEGETLWVQRGLSAPFLGGYWAFPGGMVSEADLITPHLLPDIEHNRESNRVRSMKRAALRETVEELGLQGVDLTEYENHLKPIGTWSTHPYITRTVSCEFFSVSCDELGLNSEELVDGRHHHHTQVGGHPELSQVEWLTAQEMYQRWRRGEVTLAPPTLAICRALAAGQPPEEAREHSPELLILNQVTPSIQLLPLKSPTLPPATHTNAYLLGETTFYLVDPGTPKSETLTPLFDHIDSRLSQGHQLEGVILTHHHYDHASGLSEVLLRYQVPVYAHPETARLLWGDQPLEAYQALEEGQLVRWQKCQGGTDYSEVWHTPGHAPGHVCLIHPSTETGITGDMVAGVGTIVIDPYDEGDMGDYLKSLARLRRRGLRRLLPSHGAPIANPEIILSRYIDHRNAREDLIYKSLSSAGPISAGGGEAAWSSLAQIVSIAYQDAPPSVKKGPHGGLAGRAALAHLIHLQQQRRAICSQPSTDIKSRWIAYSPSLDSLAISTARLQQMMTTLRVQCPWDRAQTLDSLRRYLVEESYEVLDSLHDPAAHQGELGDLFFQILFQSIIREEEGHFSLSHVMDSLAAKLARRHPHVFGELFTDDPEEVRAQWQRIKAQERAQKRAQRREDQDDLTTSILDGIPQAAPALLRAQLIGEKVSSIGFDWPSVEGALAKVDEEREEVSEAIELGDQAHIISEIGDLLFAIVNVCRHLNISPETALEKTNRTFSLRFKHVEKLTA